MQMNMKTTLTEEKCNICGRSVKKGHGLFINRIICDLSQSQRLEKQRSFPVGDYICRECDAGENPHIVYVHDFIKQLLNITEDERRTALNHATHFLTTDEEKEFLECYVCIVNLFKKHEDNLEIIQEICNIFVAHEETTQLFSIQRFRRPTFYVLHPTNHTQQVKVINEEPHPDDYRPAFGYAYGPCFSVTEVTHYLNFMNVPNSKRPSRYKDARFDLTFISKT